MQYNCNILLLNVSSKEHTYITDIYKLYVCIYIYIWERENKQIYIMVHQKWVSAMKKNKAGEEVRDLTFR